MILRCTRPTALALLPRGRGRAGLFGLLVAASLFLCGSTGHGALAQVKPTSEISRCTLITDPTAQRACIESSVHSRPAATFDPTVRKPQPAKAQLKDKSSAKSKPAAVATSLDGADAGGAAQPGTDAARKTMWRLEIP